MNAHIPPVSQIVQYYSHNRYQETIPYTSIRYAREYAKVKEYDRFTILNEDNSIFIDIVV